MLNAIESTSAKRGCFLPAAACPGPGDRCASPELDGTLFEMSNQEANEVSSGGRRDS